MYVFVFRVPWKMWEVKSANDQGYDVVISLMQDYLSQGYSLYTDNFYTSPTLVTYLYALGVHATGTRDCSRKGVPNQIKGLRKTFSCQEGHY